MAITINPVDTEPAITPPATPADYQIIITARKSSGGIYSKDVGYDSNGHILFEVHQGRGRYSTGYLSYNQKGALVFSRAKCANIIVDMKKRVDEYKKSGAAPARIIAVDESFYFFTIFNYSVPGYELDARIDLKWWTENLAFIDFFSGSPENRQAVYQKTDNQQVDYNKRVYLDFADHDLQESKDCVKLRALEGNKPAIDDTPAVDTTAPTENPVPVEDTTAPATENTPVDTTAPTEIPVPVEDTPAPATENTPVDTTAPTEIIAAPEIIAEGAPKVITRETVDRLVQATNDAQKTVEDLIDSNGFDDFDYSPAAMKHRQLIRDAKRIASFTKNAVEIATFEYTHLEGAADANCSAIPVKDVDAALDVESKIRAKFPKIDFTVKTNSSGDATISRVISFTGADEKTFNVVAVITPDVKTGKITLSYLDGETGKRKSEKIDAVDHRLAAVFKYIDACTKKISAPEPEKRTLNQAEMRAREKAAQTRLDKKLRAEDDIRDAYEKQGVIYEKGDTLDVDALNTALAHIVNPRIVFGNSREPYSDIVTLIYTSTSEEIPCSAMVKMRAVNSIAGNPNNDWNIRLPNNPTDADDLKNAGYEILHRYSMTEKLPRHGYGRADSVDGIYRKFTVIGSNQVFLINTDKEIIKSNAKYWSAVLTRISVKTFHDGEIEAIEAARKARAENDAATPAITFNIQAAATTNANTTTEEVIPMTINAGTSILAIQNSAAAAANANATAKESTTIDTKETIEMTENTNTAAGDTFTLGTTESEIDALVDEGNALAKIVNDAEMHSLYLDEKISTALSDGEDPEIYIAESKALQPTIAQESRITEINHRLHELGATGGFYSNEDSHIVFMSHVDAAGDKHCELLDINNYAGFYAAQSTANTATATTSAEIDATVEATEDTIAVANTTTTIADATDILVRGAIAEHKREKDTAAPVENPAPEIDATPAPANDDTPATDATAPILFMSDCHPTDAELGITCKKVNGKTVYYKANGEKVSGDKLADHRRARTNEYAAENTIEGQMQDLLLQMNWHLNDLHDDWVKYATAASANMAREFNKKLLGSLKAPSDNTQARINMAIANLKPGSYDADPSDIAREHEKHSAALAESQAALKALVDKYPPVASKFALRVHNALHATAPALPVFEYPAEMTPAASDAADNTAPAPVEDTPAEQETPAPVIVDTPVDAPVDPLAEIDLDDYALNAGAIDAFVDAEITLVTEIFAGRIKSTILTADADLRNVAKLADGIIDEYADMCKARANLDACDAAAVGILKADPAIFNITDALTKIARDCRIQLGLIDSSRRAIERGCHVTAAYASYLGDVANDVYDLLTACPAAANDTLVAALVNDFNALFDAECGRIGAALELVNSIRTPLETAPDAPPATPKNPAPVVDPAPANPVEDTPVDTPDAPVENPPADNTPADPVVDTPVEDTPAPVDTEPAVVDSPVTANDIQSLITTFDTAVESINADAAKPAFDNISATFNPIRADFAVVDESLTAIEENYAKFKASLAAPATPVDKAEKPADQPKSSKKNSTPAAKVPATPKKKDKPEPTALDKCKAAFREANKLKAAEFVAKADIALADWRKAIAAAGESDTAIAEYNAAIDSFNARGFCSKRGITRNHYTAA